MKESEHAAQNVNAQAIIEAVLSHVGMRAPSFAKAIGINYQRIFDLQSGRTKKFNPGVVNLIVKAFPEISKTYLYTGEGSLVDPTVDPTSVLTPGTPAATSDMLGMTSKVFDLLRQISDKEARLQARGEELSQRERELLERERELNDREHELNLREVELERIAEKYGDKKDDITASA